MKKNLLGFSFLSLAGAATMVFLCIKASSFQSPVYGIKEITGTCGDISFGSKLSNVSGEVKTSSFTTTNIGVTEVSANKVYAKSIGNALKFGTATVGGEITFSFDKSYEIVSLRVLAYNWSSSSPSDLTVRLSDEYSVTHTVDSFIPIIESGSYLDASTDEYDDCFGPSWLSYTGFSGFAESLTLTSSSRLLLSKIVFSIGASESYSSSVYSSYTSNASEYASSFESSSTSIVSVSSAPSSIDSSSDSIASSSSSRTRPTSSSSSKPSSSDVVPPESSSSGYSFSDTSDSWDLLSSSGNFIDYSSASQYRIQPISSIDGKNVDCYVYNGSTSRFYLAETLTYGGVYIDPNEVSLYYQAFREMPANYLFYNSSDLSSLGYTSYYGSNEAKRLAYEQFGNRGRLYTYYCKTTGYATKMPLLNEVTYNGATIESASSSFFYVEADIALTDAYASGTSWNRGAGRLVIFPEGVQAYNDGPFIVKTLDHYGKFREFSNFIEGWGANWNGTSSNPDLGSYSPLTTISLNI